MQIIIDESEIQEALNNYCAKQVKIPEGKRIKIDFTVGRGPNSGTRATIDFEDIDDGTETKALNDAFTPPAEQKAKEATAKVNKIVEEAAKENPPEKPKAAPKKDKPVDEPVKGPDPAPEEPSGSDALFNTEVTDETKETEKSPAEKITGDSLFDM